MAAVEIVGLALAVAGLLPLVKAGIEECLSLRDAPENLASFRRDLETHYATLNIAKATIEEISKRSIGDQPEPASILHIVQLALSYCEETASELKFVLERTTGRFRAYFKEGEMSALRQKLTSRTTTLMALFQALKNGINWRGVGKIALWTILGAALLITAVYAVPLLITYFTGGVAATGLGVGAVPTAMLPWTAASYISYATTLVYIIGNTAAASAVGTSVAAASTAVTLPAVSTMSALGVTLII